MTVQIKKQGTRFTIEIPTGIANRMELLDGMALDITTQDDSLVMKKGPGRSRRSIDQIVAKIKPSSYRRRRMELGEDRPVGKEPR